MADEHARDDMIGHWIITQRKHPDRMEEKEIQGGATANLGAGAGSMGTALQAFVHCIAKDRIRLKRLQVELDATTARNELGSVASWAQVQQLPYLKVCVN
jgi:cytochrome P450